MQRLLPQLLTPLDVALWLSLPAERVLRMARRGEIPCVVLPVNEILFDREELARWINSLNRREKGDRCNP